jgi:hypothetical protein
MTTQLFDTDFTTEAAAQQRFDDDALIFEERNPLDPTLLHEIETELAAITGCTKKNRVRLTVCSTNEWNQVVAKFVPQRLHKQGMVKHFRVLKDPQDPRHLFVGPSALSGLNDGHSTVITDLVHQMIAALGSPSSQAFDRGAADLLAAEVGRRLEIAVFPDIYPEEQRFLSTLIDAVRQVDEDPIELLGLLKRKPDEFYARLRQSGFYRWWEGSARENDVLSQYVDLISSIAAPSAQLEGSFMTWAQNCAEIYCDYRVQQRKNALAGAAKRAEA